MLKKIFIILFIALLIYSCNEEHVSEPYANSIPKTFVSLFPDGEMRPMPSRQNLHWWGVDVDGLIVGYYISFDSTHWTFTQNNGSLFTLTLSRPDTTYMFYVKAIDNSGNGVYDRNTPFGSEPFTDLNGNNQYDQGEPFIDLGNVDPVGASIRIRIANTAPVVSFIVNSDVPDTTFPVASFSWNGTDLDGDETITKYYWVLDDTNKIWTEIPGSVNLLTLFKKDGLSQGNHVFYLKAKDIAGAYSKVIRMPDDNGIWYVKEPVSDFLIVDDYGVNDNSASFYKAFFDTLANKKYSKYDVLDIKLGVTSTTRGVNVPAFVHPTLTETFKLFKIIFWYSDNTPSIETAQRTLPGYKKAGGKVLFSAAFPENLGEAQGSIVDFAPIDGISSTTITFVPQETQIIPDPQNAIGYPVLERDKNTIPVVFIRGVIPKIDARALYTMVWSGNPVMAVKDADKPAFILVGLPLHRFNGGQGRLGEFFIKAFNDLGY